MNNSDIQSILSSLTNQKGILGCLLTTAEGEVVTSTLPENMDVKTTGVLATTLFSNNDISLRRMNRGNLIQMTLLTNQGILHFYQVGQNLLLVMTATGQQIDLEELITFVENTSKNLLEGRI